MIALTCAWYEPPPNLAALTAMGLSEKELAALNVITVRPVLSSFVSGGICFVVVDFEGGCALDVSKVQLELDA